MPTVSLTCTHTTVLLQEAVDALVHEPQGSYLDATFGRGGHSRAILARMGPNARLCAFDQDPQAVQSAQDLLQDPRFSIRHVPFSSLRDWPAASLSGVLLDIGVSSPQIDQAERGFSFRHDGPLDMRMDPTRGRSVHQWLVTASQEEIAGVIRDHGEERFAVQIAKAIVARREERGAPASTAELAQLVAGTVKTREPGQDPATRTFQAFRIHINAELEELQQALEASIHALQPGGRLVVISFHSLEDRMVKQFITQHSREVYDRRTPFAATPELPLRALGRQRPSAEEVKANPRSRSAIMRVAERVSTAREQA